jgi:hypothetical protein
MYRRASEAYCCSPVVLEGLSVCLNFSQASLSLRKSRLFPLSTSTLLVLISFTGFERVFLSSHPCSSSLSSLAPLVPLSLISRTHKQAEFPAFIAKVVAPCKFFSAVAQQHASVAVKESEVTILVGDAFSEMPHNTARCWDQTFGRSQLQCQHNPDAIDVDVMHIRKMCKNFATFLLSQVRK